MNDGTVNRFAAIADKMERDPYGPDGTGRAVVVNGRGFQTWRKFHPGEATVWVTNPEGQQYELTMTQHRVYVLSMKLSDVPLTLATLADSLKVSRSTVWRALVKLVAFGLIIYRTGRGRSARTIIFLRVKADGLTRMQMAAKAKVREWSKYAEKRLSRLRENVALSIPRGRGRDSLTDYYNTSSSSKSATLKAPWGWEEIEEALR